MKTASIPSRWFALHPSMRMDATFWLRVENERALRGIDADDDAAMRALILEIEQEDKQ